MTTDAEYRITVTMVGHDGKDYAAVWRDADGRPDLGVYSTRYAEIARKVWERLAAGEAPDGLAADLTAYARVDVSPVRRYVLFDGGRAWQYHSDLTGTRWVRFDAGFGPQQIMLDVDVDAAKAKAAAALGRVGQDLPPAGQD